MPDAFRRAAVAAARWRPGLSYAVARELDRVPFVGRRKVESGWGRDPHTRVRQFVLLEIFRSETARWPYPRLVSGTDPASLRGPMVITGFHSPTVSALGTLFTHLPEPKVGLTFGNRFHVSDEWLHHFRDGDQVAAFKLAVDTLRAGGFVLSLADGVGQSRIDTAFDGRPVSLPRGTFAMARLAGAPLLPLVAWWRGSSMAIAAGEPIPPRDEREMSTALMDWLAVAQREHPEAGPFRLLERLRALPTS